MIIYHLFEWVEIFAIQNPLMWFIFVFFLGAALQWLYERWV